MHFPLHFNLKGKRLLFVGAGKVNERRIRALLPSGCSIKVVAPDATDTVAELARRGALVWIKRPFVPGDLEGVDLAFVAIPEGYSAVVEEARKRGIPVECASSGELGDFIVPAVVRRGDVLVSVSTSGKDPALSARLKKEIEALLERLGV